jgi:hypothetical protein
MDIQEIRMNGEEFLEKDTDICGLWEYRLETRDYLFLQFSLMTTCILLLTVNKPANHWCSGKEEL